MCLEAAKSIPTGELLAYKLIARRKEDGVFVSPIQKSHVWNTNRVVVLDDSPEIWESSTGDKNIERNWRVPYSEKSRTHRMGGNLNGSYTASIFC